MSNPLREALEKLVRQVERAEIRAQGVTDHVVLRAHLASLAQYAAGARAALSVTPPVDAIKGFLDSYLKDSDEYFNAARDLGRLLQVMPEPTAEALNKAMGRAYEFIAQAKALDPNCPEDEAALGIAISQAILPPADAEPVASPVAWREALDEIYDDIKAGLRCGETNAPLLRVHDKVQALRASPLFTAPPESPREGATLDEAMVGKIRALRGSGSQDRGEEGSDDPDREAVTPPYPGEDAATNINVCLSRYRNRADARYTGNALAADMEQLADALRAQRAAPPESGVREAAKRFLANMREGEYDQQDLDALCAALQKGQDDE
jgi:hypothetical protein